MQQHLPHSGGGQLRKITTKIYNEHKRVPIILYVQAEQPSDTDTGAINMQNTGQPIYITYSYGTGTRREHLFSYSG